MKKCRLFLAVVVLGGFLGNAWAYDFSGPAKRYNVPVELLEAISKVESGHNNLAINKNRDGSLDLGHMQVNSRWQNSGKIEWSKLTDPDYCANVGAWILAMELSRYQGNIWAAVGAYNTGKSARDWEELAALRSGAKKDRALALAGTARAYARKVYAAMVQIRALKGAGKGQAYEAEKQPEKKQVSLTAMAVQNPFGTVY